MNSIVGLENLSWNLSRSKYDEIDSLPLMANPRPVLMILATYLLFVLKLGPDFMRKRPAFKLTGALFTYNVIQVVASIYMVQRYFRLLLDVGLTPTKCFLDDNNYRSEMIVGVHIYLMAKISELLDTVFFVLRKKDNQVTFLHLYHHTLMVIGTWGFFKYTLSPTVLFIGFLNSLVHVFMYAYYGLAALGPHMAKYLTWKKYITTFQLVQFISFITQFAASIKVSECPPPKGMAIFILANILVFIILFGNFYRQSYIKKNEKKVINKSLYSIKESDKDL